MGPPALYLPTAYYATDLLRQLDAVPVLFPPNVCDEREPPLTSNAARNCTPRTLTGKGREVKGIDREIHASKNK
jgi:hypothetical protein